MRFWLGCNFLPFPSLLHFSNIPLASQRRPDFTAVAIVWFAEEVEGVTDLAREQVILVVLHVHN